MHHQITSITTHIAGAQDGVVDARYADSANRHIQIQSGAVWISCLDLAAIASHAAAWSAARDAAAWLPEHVDLPKIDTHLIGSAIIRARGTVTAALYEAQLEANPYLEVRVGPLRTRAFDQAAVASLAHTWSRATNLALALWSTHAGNIDSPAVADIINRAGTRPSHSRNLPPTP